MKQDLYRGIELKKGEQVDDLQYGGLELIQKEDGFRFGVDAVLLADFAAVRRNEYVADLGAGSGIIPILLAGKTEASFITGIEIQEELADMATRSILMNGLGGRAAMICGDIRQAERLLGSGRFDVVVSNPPYIRKAGGIVNPSDSKAVARHEIKCTLQDVIRAAAGLLAEGGRFAMVHKPERLADIICLMRDNSIEPKHLRFVHPSPGKKANIMLIGGIKGGRPELKMMEPLYIYNADGRYSDEIDRIYARQKNSRPLCANNSGKEDAHV